MISQSSRKVSTVEATEPKTEDDWVDSLLVPQQSEEPEETAEETEDAQTDEAPDAEADDETETEAETDDAEIDGEEVDQQDEDDPEDDRSEEPQVFSVKVDGEDRQVTLEELQRGYAGQSYIQKGMQDVSAKRKEAETVFQQLQQDREKLSHLIAQIEDGGIASEPQPPVYDPNDPVGYIEAKAAYDQAKQQYEQQRVQLDAARSEQTEAQQRAMQAYVAEQKQLLAQAIPDLADPEKGDRTRAALVKAGEQYGYTTEELQGIMDHRALKVLDDARKYRELKNVKATRKTEKTGPKVKPQAKGDPVKVNREKQWERARKGDEAAALSLILKE